MGQKMCCPGPDDTSMELNAAPQLRKPENRRGQNNAKEVGGAIRVKRLESNYD